MTCTCGLAATGTFHPSVHADHCALRVAREQEVAPRAPEASGLPEMRVEWWTVDEQGRHVPLSPTAVAAKDLERFLEMAELTAWRKQAVDVFGSATVDRVAALWMGVEASFCPTAADRVAALVEELLHVAEAALLKNGGVLGYELRQAMQVPK